MKDVNARVQDIYKYVVDPNYVLHKLAELEHRELKNNLHIDDINKEKGKTREMCEVKVKNIFQEKFMKASSWNVFIEQKEKQLQIMQQEKTAINNRNKTWQV